MGKLSANNVAPEGGLPGALHRRDIRIDIIRGIAILTILLNHLAILMRSINGYHGPVIPTLTQFGYSTAASIFVTMSGYMVGMVYLRRPNPAMALVRRAGQLYLVNLVIFVALLVIAFAAPPEADRYWGLRPIIEPPYDQLLLLFALLDSPPYLDVLQLYVTLMLLAALTIPLIRRSRSGLAACSIGLWAVMQVVGLVLPPEQVPFNNGHSLNVLAWQMTFVLPMIAGTMKLHEQIFAWFARRPKATVAIWGLIGVGALARAVNAHNILPYPQGMISRPLSGPVGFGHSVLVLAGYLGLVTWLTPYLRHWPLQFLASLGRNTLNIFAASIPLTYLLALMVGWLDAGFLGYLAGVTALLLCSDRHCRIWRPQEAAHASRDGRTVRRRELTPAPKREPLRTDREVS